MRVASNANRDNVKLESLISSSSASNDGTAVAHVVLKHSDYHPSIGATTTPLNTATTALTSNSIIASFTSSLDETTLLSNEDAGHDHEPRHDNNNNIRNNNKSKPNTTTINNNSSAHLMNSATTNLAVQQRKLAQSQSHLIHLAKTGSNILLKMISPGIRRHDLNTTHVVKR